MADVLKLIDLVNLHLYDREIKKYIDGLLEEFGTHTHANKEVLDKLTDELYVKLVNWTVDTSLIENSTNPVESQVIQAALADLEKYVDTKVNDVALETHTFSIAGEATAAPVTFDGTQDVVLNVTQVHATSLYLNPSDTLILNGDCL